MRSAVLQPVCQAPEAAALNLHGFYAGLEHVFVVVAERIDGSLPSGAAWHQELLRQMAVELPGVRPVGELVEDLPPTLARLRTGLTGFADGLDEIAQG